MLAHVVKAQQSRVRDQDAEDAVAAREIPDRGMGGLVDPDREEALEALAAVVEHAESGVPGTRQLSRNLEHALQQPLDVELRDQRAADIEEAVEPVLAKDRFFRLAGQIVERPLR
jgi:hypothetical protein